MTLVGRVSDVASLTSDQVAAMYDLFSRHYLNVAWPTFAADLAEKTWVILIEDSHRRLRGFSTQAILEIPHAGHKIRALFSGDTVIDRDAWGDQALARTWGRFALELIDRFHPVPLYWLLISKGYKTYRFLPLFFNHFYPRYDEAMPPRIQELLDLFCRYKFGTAYDSRAGIVRAQTGKDCLRPGLADLTPERLADPHVRFVAERNPAYAQGDELCCLAPLSRDNFTEAAWRVIGRAFRHSETTSCRLPAC